MAPLRDRGQLISCACGDSSQCFAPSPAPSAHAPGPAFQPLAARELLLEARVERAAELDDQGFLRMWPHRHHTGGFFAAAWRRRA